LVTTTKADKLGCRNQINSKNGKTKNPFLLFWLLSQDPDLNTDGLPDPQLCVRVLRILTLSQDPDFKSMVLKKEKDDNYDFF
jgi:hypothetical protein